jgi:hypothetical protein
VVEQDNVRVIIDAPEMFFAARIVFRRIAIHPPVGNSVDGVGIRFFIRLLEPSSDEIAKIVFDSVDFLLGGIDDIFSSNIGGFAQSLTAYDCNPSRSLEFVTLGVSHPIGNTTRCTTVWNRSTVRESPEDGTFLDQSSSGSVTKNSSVKY